MTKREMRARLEKARANAWQQVMTYEREHNVERFPEQRKGALTWADLEAAQLRGRVAGLDIARLELGVRD